MDETAARSTSDQRGTTTFADVVVAKTAGIAAREIPGVHALGGAGSQVIGAMRRRIPGGSDLTSGVSVQVGQTQTAIDLNLVVDYGEELHRVAEAVRGNVIDTVERTTGLEVVEVNIVVTNVYLEGADDNEDEDNSGGRNLR